MKQITYQEFVKKNLPHYIRSGLHPTDAMREVGRDWQMWKMGVANPYAHYAYNRKTGRWRLVVSKRKKKNPKGLFESFHGTPPVRARKVSFTPPKSPLIKIGRLSQINYVPEFPSKRSKTEYYHISGDIGTKVLKSNLILATDAKGENLYLIKDGKSKYPIFTERGIIG